MTQIIPAGLPSASVAHTSLVASPGLAPVPSSDEPKSVGHSQAQPTPEVAAAQVNQHLGTAQTNLKLQVDPASNRGFFQIVQARTGMVLLQVPSDEVLAMSHRIQEASTLKEASGALVDKSG